MHQYKNTKSYSAIIEVLKALRNNGSDGNSISALDLMNEAQVDNKPQFMAAVIGKVRAAVVAVGCSRDYMVWKDSKKNWHCSGPLLGAFIKGTAN